MGALLLDITNRTMSVSSLDTVEGQAVPAQPPDVSLEWHILLAVDRAQAEYQTT